MVEPALREFVDEDEFLRRVRYPDHFKRGVLLWRAFKKEGAQMSWTLRNDDLRTDVGLDAYHAHFSELVGEKLPAILWFSFYGLTRGIDPPLEPKHDNDPDDLKYGHLHCSTSAPHDREHMEVLAKLVNDGKHAGIAGRYMSRQ